MGGRCRDYISSGELCLRPEASELSWPVRFQWSRRSVVIVGEFMRLLAGWLAKTVSSRNKQPTFAAVKLIYHISSPIQCLFSVEKSTELRRAQWQAGHRFSTT